MNVVDLDGNTQAWNITGHTNKTFAKKSSFHNKAREIIRFIYPTMQILEEVPVYLRKSEIVYLDFYLPLNRKCLEIHGQQHYEFTPFYHANKMSFLKAQKRDRDKKQWCEANNISYIELAYNNTEEWERIIANN